MADLTTVDPSQPLDSELASLGASRIREGRAGTAGFAGLEHFLNGAHKFLSGSTAGRPAAGNGGRVYVNTQNGSVESDTGAQWQNLRTNNPQFVANATTFTLVAATPINILNINFFCSANAFAFLIVAVRIHNPTLIGQTLKILMGIDGVAVSLGDGDPFLMFPGNSTATCWGLYALPLSEGGHSTGVTLTNIPGNVDHTFSQFCLFTL